MPPGDFLSHRSKRNFKRARQALEAGNFEELKQFALSCVSDAPQIESGWFMLAEAYANLGLNHEGIILLDDGLERFPEKYHLKVQRCKFLMGLGRRQECLQQAQELLSLGEPDIWSIYVLAKVLNMLDEVSLARPLYQRACELDPDNPKNWIGLAVCERYCGEFEQAIEHLRRALKIEPDHAHALWILSSLRKASASDNSIEQMHRALSDGHKSPLEQAYLGYGLGKEFEDCEMWDDAFAAVKTAGVARRISRPYDHRKSEDLVESVISSYDKAELEKPASGSDSDEPVFIVGMPRTGTTLVERILGSHSDVFAAGELRQLALAVQQVTDGGGGSVLDADQIKRSTQLDFRELGEAYIASTRPRTGDSPRFTDKLPINYLYQGIIARALPNAKIIHLRRNPLDTCWSNFKVFFGDLFEYSYDMADTAAYYVLYDRLLRHWREVMPDRFLEVEYESLIENPEAETRRLLQYCELPWQDQCLDFHRSKATVTTASSVQVRQPIYKSSLQRWKYFEAGLQPAKEIFDAAGISYQ
jgi:tetratricopeptide (TPR) repeat protein